MIDEDLLASYRVLIVDDYPDIANLLALALRRAGCYVQVAQSGAECLELSQQFQPQVVLLDISMPDIDGYEVARCLKAQRTNRPTLIALTGLGGATDYQQSADAGFALHLLKPVHIDELKQVLRQLAAIDSGRPLATPLKWLNVPEQYLPLH